jgi:HAD superfamily hydrolase (TIGR01509 family)
MNSPEAVLFDFDGVLAETENVHVAAWERLFGAMGWDVDPATCARAAEEDDRAFLADVFAGRGVVEGDVEGWVRRKRDLTREILGDAPRLHRGVARLVAALRGRARLAVVSTTWRENIDAVLGPAGLRDAFELIVAKEDVRSVKPDPEAYRTAVEGLGVPAQAAVAVEDSPTGLASARAAGVRVVLVGHRRPEGPWAEGSPFLTDLRDTRRVLRALGLS